MKKLFIFFAYLLITLYAVIFFAPKLQLYYQAETLLQKYNIAISKEIVQDRGFVTHIREGEIYFDDLRVAKIEHISLTTLLFYNALHVDAFSFADDMRRFVPLSVERIDLRYSITSPLHITLSAVGAFGELTGSVDLRARIVRLFLSPSKELLAKKPFWLRKLKKSKEGGYIYESSY